MLLQLHTPVADLCAPEGAPTVLYHGYSHDFRF